MTGLYALLAGVFIAAMERLCADVPEASARALAVFE